MNVSRREYLRAFASGTLLAGVSTGSAAGSRSDGTVDQHSRFELSYPTNVSGSFLNVSAATPYLMGTSGWSEVPVTEKIHTIRRLHAEKLDLHRDFGGSEGPPTQIAGGETTVQGHLAEDIALPAAGQQHLNLHIDSLNLWFDKLPPEQKWTKSDGSKITSALDLAARRFNGEAKINERFGSAVPTLFFEKYRNHMADAAASFIAHGYSQVYLDNAIMPTWQGLDFSEWAQSAFRNHLASLSESRLEELGVGDPGSFDIADYLQREGLGVDQVDTPFEGPIAREYKRFQFQAHRSYMEAYRDRIHDTFPNRSDNDGIVVVGNLGIDKLDPSAVILADVFDAVYGESEQTVPGRTIIDRSYKLGNAAGRFERPVVSVGSMITGGRFENSSAEGFDPSREYTTLQNLQLAEGFANGGLRSVSLAGWGMTSDQAVDNWIRPDGSVPSELQSFLDFCWAQKAFLTGGEAHHDVALVYSLPTAMWQRAPLWDSRDSEHSTSFDGLSALLRKYKLPYDALVFGMPGVWNDGDQLERLSTYQTVVLPSVEAVSDAQVDAIRAALEEGVRVVATGGGPVVDADNGSREDVQRLLQEHENATVIEDSPGIANANNETPATELTESLDVENSQVRVNPTGVVPTVRRQRDPDRVIVHLVNYDYNRDSDSVPIHEDLSVDVRAPGLDISDARWLSPSGETTLDVTPDGNRVQVTIPRLDVWGMLVMSSDPSAFDRGNEGSANDAVERAATKLNQTRDAGRTHIGLARAEAELENAKVASEHGAYELAEKTAERAVSAADNVGAPPVIGIDQAHGQSAAGYDWSEFEKLRSRFDRYHFRAIGEWSSSKLSELDLFVIPPKINRDYNFTSAELDKLESFAGEGGGVVVLGAPSVSADVSELLSRFGLGFDGDLIVQPGPVFGRVAEEGTNLRKFDAVGKPSSLTQYAISFRSIHATPVTVEADTAEELAHVHENRGAFVNRTGSTDDRNDEDVPAGGLPILAAVSTGEGYVAALGTAEHFLAPTQSRFGARTGDLDDPLIASLLRSAESSPSSLETPSSTLTATESSTTTETPTSTDTTTSVVPSEGGATASSAPGFSIWSGVAGVAGASVLLRWLFEDDEV